MKSFLICLIICFSITASFSQGSAQEGAIDNVKLSVSKLIIKGNDISDSLKLVYIVNGMWMEYNKNDVEIGRAKILKNSNNEIKIKWISAKNGAKKGAITIYEVKRGEGEYTFDIYYDDKKQGYFIGKAYD